ncbi:MAG TPA: hypothetical protein VFN18_13315 [Solirubrobacterales bacterium]|nr:hypothetical protein [Solirubrobacterales bacterium]
MPVQYQLDTGDAEDTNVEWKEHLTEPAALDRLEIRHDVLVNTGGRARFELDGRWRVETFKEYVRTHHIEAYATADRSLMMIGGAGEVVKSAYATLSKSMSGRLRLVGREVDFKVLTPNLGRLRGAWFTRSSGSLHALGMFGQDVKGSPEWEEQTITSELQTVMVNHLFQDEFHTIQLTADCGVVVYSNLERSKLLALVRDVYDSLLRPSLKPL